jgi:hypothetical protein
MKRTRRVSIEIEQRKLTFSFTRTTAPDPGPGIVTEGSGTELESASHPPVCPNCGAPWITVTAHAADVGIAGANAIYRALQQHGLHLHVSPAGKLRICSKSFEETRFEEIKESL